MHLNLVAGEAALSYEYQIVSERAYGPSYTKINILKDQRPERDSRGQQRRASEHAGVPVCVSRSSSTSDM